MCVKFLKNVYLQLQHMKKAQINIGDIEIIAKDFAESFEGWSVEKTIEYLNSPYKLNPEYCLKSLNEEGEITGGIFCKLAPYKTNVSLVIEALQILKSYRSEGYGKFLILEIINLAKEKGIESISMLAPNKDKFPKEWYKSIGFRETGWVEMELEM